MGCLSGRAWAWLPDESCDEGGGARERDSHMCIGKKKVMRC
jgi:hypothetical protein